MHKKIIFIISLLLPLCLQAQWGGKSVYSFLSLPMSPREAALGGSAIAINDNDLSLAMSNPALLNEQMKNKFLVEYTNYISDINFGRVSYVHNLKNVGLVGLGLQYLNAGKFINTDVSGNKYGNFSANEIALNIAYKKRLDSCFVLGATLKPIFSQLYHYYSFGIVLDIGANYTTKNKLTTASLLLKNVGSQITTYKGNYESVPFDIQLGVSTKLAHAPFRLSVVAHSLNRLKMVHDETNNIEPTNTTESTTKNKNTFVENMFRHFILGVEFIPVESFFVRLGLNYQRRQELKLEAKPGLTGFSWGFGFRIKKFYISYANVRYHSAAYSNQFSITTNLSDFIK